MIDATAIHSYLSFARAELHNGHIILHHSDVTDKPALNFVHFLFNYGQ